MGYKALILAAAVLVGCTEVNQKRDLLAACEGYVSVLTSLAALRLEGRLSDDSLMQLASIHALVDPVCDSETPPENVAEALRTVEDAALRALELKAQAEE